MGANASSPSFNGHHRQQRCPVESKFVCNGASVSVATDGNGVTETEITSPTQQKVKRGRRRQAIAKVMSNIRKVFLRPRKNRGEVVDRQTVTAKRSSSSLSRQQAPVADFDDLDLDNCSIHSRCISSEVQQGRTLTIINQPQQKPGTTMTHVRIRISCSDTLGETFRRCDATTQTEAAASETCRSVLRRQSTTGSITRNSITSSSSTNSSQHHRHSNKENNNRHNSEDVGRIVASKSSSSTISERPPPPITSWLASGGSMGSNSSSGVDVNSPPDHHYSSTSSAISSATNSTSSLGMKNKQQVLNKAPNSGESTSSRNQQSSRAVVTRRTTIQASTGELLECLGLFVKNRFNHIAGVTNTTVVTWMRAIDRTLLSQGWQDTPFISPGTVVFAYMLLRDSTMPHPSARLNFSQPSPRNGTNHHLYYNAADAMYYDASLKPTLFDLHCHVNACLYIAYSYAGIEISYPQRPFNVVEPPPSTAPPTSTVDFWQRTLDITLELSDKMLRLNSEPLFFARTFAELKSQGVATVATNTTIAAPLNSSSYYNQNHNYGNNVTPPHPPIHLAELATRNCSFKSATLAPIEKQSIICAGRNFATRNSHPNCRSSVITPGIMMAREHYASLIV